MIDCSCHRERRSNSVSRDKGRRAELCYSSRFRTYSSRSLCLSICLGLSHRNIPGRCNIFSRGKAFGDGFKACNSRIDKKRCGRNDCIRDTCDAGIGGDGSRHRNYGRWHCDVNVDIRGGSRHIGDCRWHRDIDINIRGGNRHRDHGRWHCDVNIDIRGCS